MMTQTCPRCGAVVRDGARFCSECGAEVRPAQVIVDTQAPPVQKPFPLEDTRVANSFPRSAYRGTGRVPVRSTRRSSSLLQMLIGVIVALVIIIVAFKVIGLVFGLLWGVIIPLLVIAALIYLAWRLVLGGRRRGRRRLRF
jgi:hypothetical protein